MGIFKKICQAINEFMALPADHSQGKQQSKQAKQPKQTSDLRGKHGKKCNKKNKEQQAVPPKQAAKQKNYYTGNNGGYDDYDYDYIAPAAFATGAAINRIHFDPIESISSTDWESDNISHDMFKDSDLMSDSLGPFSIDPIERSMWGGDDLFGHQEICSVGGFDGIIGPDSADPMEQAKWGGSIDDSFSSPIDDSFGSSSIDDSLSNSFDDSFSSSFSSGWDD